MCVRNCNPLQEVKRLQESKKALLEQVGALDKEKATLRHDMATIEDGMKEAKIHVQEGERERQEAEEETRYLVERQQEFVKRQRVLQPEIKHLHEQNTQQFSILSVSPFPATRNAKILPPFSHSYNHHFCTLRHSACSEHARRTGG